MSEQTLEPEVTEEENPVVAAFDALHEKPEVEEPELTTHDEEDPLPDLASPQDASPEPSEDEEPSEEEAPSQTEDEDLEYGRRVAAILRARPDLAEAMVRIERGEAVPIPRQVLEAAQRYQAEQTPQTDPNEDIYADPFAVMAALRQEVAELKNGRQQEYVQRVQQEETRRIGLIQEVEGEFLRSNPGLENNQPDLINAIAEMGLIKHHLKSDPDPRRATLRAYETARNILFPDFAADAANKEIQRQARQKRRAGAAAASPRSQPRNQPEETKPRNREERNAAMADVLRELSEAQT